MFKPEPTYGEWMKVYNEVASILHVKSPNMGVEMLDFLLNTPKPAEPPAPKHQRF
jgi:hypothetical protein